MIMRDYARYQWTIEQLQIRAEHVASRVYFGTCPTVQGVAEPSMCVLLITIIFDCILAETEAFLILTPLFP